MEIRKMELQDVRDVLGLIKQTIRTINKKDYAEGQIEVWASGFSNVEKWQRCLSEEAAWVMISHKKIIGVASLTADGVLDLLYVHKGYQNQGVASRLLDRVEKEARANLQLSLFTGASKTALPFFNARGFMVIEEQSKEIQGTWINNFKMCKKLNT